MSCLNCELRRLRYFFSTRLWRLRECPWREGGGSGLEEWDLDGGEGLLVGLDALADLGGLSGRLRFGLLASDCLGPGLWCRFWEWVVLGLGS